MKFIHYSDQPITELWQWEYPSELEGRFVMGKPNGTWFSVEEAAEEDQDWFTWCTQENFCVEALVYAHKIKFKPDSRVLYLKSIAEILDFNEMYGYQMFPFICRSAHMCELEKRMEEIYPYYVSLEKSMDSIRWEAVKANWQAIVIAPYQWPLRLHSACRWYYGWDCASGCVWDINAIESFSLEPRKLIGLDRR